MPVLPMFETINAIVLAAAGAGVCPDVPPPRIAVLTRRQPTQIHHSLSQAELENFKTTTDLPMQMHDLSHVETGGLMRGDIGIGYQIDFGTTPGATPETNAHECVRYKDITVTLTIKPEIYVATNYAPQSCWYHEILEHEESHIDMDQVVIDKYSGRIEAGLKMAFSQPGDSTGGPVDPRGTEALKKDMGRNVVDMVNVMVRDMARERAEKQHGVDSFGGYAYIMNACYDGDNVIELAP